MSDTFQTAELRKLRNQLKTLSLGQNVRLQRGRDRRKSSSPVEALSVRPKLQEFLQEEQRRHFEQVITVEELVEDHKRRQRQCAKRYRSAKQLMLYRVYQRPLLCELARDPSLEVKHDPAPSSCHSPEVYDDSDLQDDPSEPTSSYYSPSTATRSHSATIGGPVYGPAHDLDSEGVTRPNFYPNHHSVSTDRPTVNQSTTSTTEFDSDVDVRQLTDDRRPPSVRTGSYCKVHGFVPATTTNSSVSSVRQLPLAIPTRRTISGSIFEESELEDGEDDEELSYAYSFRANRGAPEWDARVRDCEPVKRPQTGRREPVPVLSSSPRSVKSKRKPLLDARHVTGDSSVRSSFAVEQVALLTRKAKSDQIGHDLGLPRHLRLCGDRGDRQSEWESDLDERDHSWVFR
ncbi:hypothetical protein BV898_13979 [Hypsibius exemplaris]|uniref:Uncharacterized protein n=1 Tax=Hypsibius exemplaris TaxID=2072580 RepID=A0A1W0W925_HYPEX|nr:hypothetical protein BV898_13979 [Hypsibius exemplaris]